MNWGRGSMGRKHAQGGEGTMSGGGAMEQTSRHTGI